MTVLHRPAWLQAATGWWHTLTTPGAPAGATEDWHPAAEIAAVRVPAGDVPLPTRRELAAEAAALHRELTEMSERWLAPVRDAADTAIRLLLAPLDPPGTVTT